MKRIMVVGADALLNRCVLAFQTVGSIQLLQTKAIGTPLLLEMNDFQPDIVLYDLGADSLSRNITEAFYQSAVTAFNSSTAPASRLALYCHMNDAKLWMVSDASVFPGKGMAVADTDPFPVHAFGLAKLLGERAARSFVPDVSIVRVGWLYGPEYPDSPPMLAEDTRNGTRSLANVQTGILGSPTFVGDAASILVGHILWSSIDPAYSGGVFHLAPREVTDWYEYLIDDYPKLTPTSIKSSREVFMGIRNASLAPSLEWVISDGGLDRFMAEVKGVEWDWKSSYGT